MTKAVVAGLHLNCDLSCLYRIKIFVFKIASNSLVLSQTHSISVSKKSSSTLTASSEMFMSIYPFIEFCSDITKMQLDVKTMHNSTKVKKYKQKNTHHLCTIKYSNKTLLRNVID